MVVNTTTRDVVINAAFNLGTAPAESVTDLVVMMTQDQTDLNIPAQSQKVEARSCVSPHPMDIFLVSTHTHEKAICTTVHDYNLSDGVEEEPLYVAKDWESPPLLLLDPGTLTVDESRGVHTACHYQNPEDRDITYGPSATDEMCLSVLVGYPSSISPQEVIDLVNRNPIAAAAAVLDASFAVCQTAAEESPWPYTEEANYAIPFEDTCQGLSTTRNE